MEYLVLTKRRGSSEDREDGLVTYVHTHEGRDTHTHKGKQLHLSERRWKAWHMHIPGRTCVRVRGGGCFARAGTGLEEMRAGGAGEASDGDVRADVVEVGLGGGPLSG